MYFFSTGKNNLNIFNSFVSNFWNHYKLFRDTGLLQFVLENASCFYMNVICGQLDAQIILLDHNHHELACFRPLLCHALQVNSPDFTSLSYAVCLWNVHLIALASCYDCLSEYSWLRGVGSGRRFRDRDPAASNQQQNPSEGQTGLKATSSATGLLSQ